MVILCDTRQQAGKHKNIDAYFDRVGIEHASCKLYVGDYMIANDARRTVDTKSGVLELILDMHAEHDRFAAECARARAAGIDLLVLVEEALPEGGLAKWKSPTDARGKPLTRTNPETLRKALITMTAKYNVHFRFCDARSTGRLIVEYLVEGVLPR